MGMNRITSGSQTSQSVQYLNNNLSILSNIQEKLSSGKNITRPSDNPVGLTRILDLSNSLRTDQRYARNVQDAVAEINTADKAMSSMVDLINRAHELATQAASFSNNQSGRDAIALEIDQIINQLVQLGNTDIGGKYVFSGMRTSTPPFSRSGDDITYSGSLTTEPWQRNIEISRGVTLTTNINGRNLLGNVTVTTAGPPLPPTFAAGSGGLFKTLIELKQDLQAGGATNQLSEIRTRLDELTTNLNNVLANQSSLGAVANRLQLTQDRIDERKSILTQQYASIQDINMAETIANLNQQQNTFQASLAVTAQLMQSSLLNYLR